MDGGELKLAQRRLYEAGDYWALSAVLEPAATALVEAAGVAIRDAVRDVAAGDGNVAVAAAARGARVVATDLSPVQVERGADRCARAGLDVAWQVADAEQLPFAPASFDHVLSAFGVVAAPNPETAAAELFRVCRPDGIVGLTAWPADAYMARLTTALRQVVGDECEFPDRDHGWGDVEVVEVRLRRHAARVDLTRRSLAWDPGVRAAAGRGDCAAAFFAGRLAPETLAEVVRARDAVEQRFRRSDGWIQADYLLAVARARGA